MARFDDHLDDDIPLARADRPSAAPGGDPGPGFGRRDGGSPESNSARILALLAALVLVAAGVTWYLWSRAQSPAAPAPEPAAEMQATETPAPAASREPEFRLPALDASDPAVRALLTRLSDQPRLAAWLGVDDLVRRFVAAVDNVAEGKSPAVHLRPLEPEGPFLARPGRNGAHPTIDPRSYRRYDVAVDVLVGLPTEALARAFAQLHPLFDQAYAELGYPGTTFDDRLRQAILVLLEVDPPVDPVALRPKVTTWEFEDPALENRSAAAKHLLRLGPDNARRVQQKLRDFAAAAGIRVR